MALARWQSTITDEFGDIVPGATIRVQTSPAPLFRRWRGERTRRDLRIVEPVREIDVEIRLLVSRRKDIVADQTRRAARIRDMLGVLFPALERIVDPTAKTGLVFLAHFASPEEIRAAGKRKIVRKLTKAAAAVRNVETIAAKAGRCSANADDRHSRNGPAHPPRQGTRRRGSGCQGAYC